MRRGAKIVIAVGVGLTVLLGSSLAGALWFVRRSLPRLEGQLAAPVTAPVVVRRDAYGVPHIRGSTLEDVLFAQGYVHAQDRLFQLDLTRRAVSGRLSEVFGEGFLQADRFLRAVGFMRAARATEADLPPELRSALQAYADGINAFIREHAGRLPLEFTLLGYKPDPWQIAESLAIAKYMAWDLGGNMQTEIFFWRLTAHLGAEKAASLFPTYPHDGPSIVDRLHRLPQQPGLAEGLARLQQVAESTGMWARDQFRGSNNWVVAPSRTASGKPILANDMHLGIGAPSIWYQNHLTVEGEFDVTGVMFPGIPGVIVGHNGHIAWGVTNVGPDVQDLRLERRHPTDPTRFEYMGKWYQAEVERHEIRVKGRSEPVMFEVLVTRHGPLISEALEELDVPCSLRWTALAPTGEFAAMLGLAQARNWAEFCRALENFAAPAQNFVYADREGNIGYRANGLFPIRRAGDGLVPVPGWTDEYDWVGFVPWDEIPQLFNPPEGYIVTANHRVAGVEYPYFLSHQWAPPYRAQAIIEALADRHELTLEDMIPIQNSWVNLQARLLGPVILRELDAVGMEGTAAAALRELEAWLDDPHDLPEAAGPTIFHTLYLKLLEATFLDEMGEDLYAAFLRHGSPVNTLDRMLSEGHADWFDDVGTPEREGLREVMAAAFARAVEELEQALGKDPARWEWGKLHTVSFDHALGAQRPLHLIFNRGPFPTGGSHVTPGAASFSLPRPFAVTSSAPWRYLVDLADLRGLDVLAIGISGHPFSVHYDDQMALWLKGEYKTLLYLEEEIAAATVATLIFRPR